ncbi:MAG: SDR family NAD(P)-dependent oxidoreductase [Chloroflexi bacterium]|nr:MAG: SDR family NAD(P)-dependent oxidoreductase [Chloroflexota bacterium]
MQDFETGRPGRAFAGQVVLVSGARQGIGAAIARAFIGEGARIAALVHKPEQAQEVEAWLASAGICVTADVTNEGECRAAVRECEDQLGACNVLVNAAGIAISKKFVDTDHRLDCWTSRWAVHRRLHGGQTRACRPHAGPCCRIFGQRRQLQLRLPCIR